MLLLTVVLLAVSYVAAQPSKYCCVPDQWEGFIGLTEGFVQGGKPGFVQGVVGLSFDYSNKRLAEIVNVTQDGVDVHQRIIIDYNKNVMYTINDAKKTCVPTSPAPPLSRCVPDTARESGRFYMGAGANTVKIVSYEIDVPSMQLTAAVSMTADSCIPVGEVAYGATGNVPFLASMGYVNVTFGIKNPSVFNLPSFCTGEKIEYLDFKSGHFLVDYVHRRMGFFQ